MLIRTIYFYYFTFYKRILSETNPHLTTVLALSFAESLLVNFILSLAEIYFYCFNVSKWQGISICLLLILVNYNYYIKRKNGDVIVDEEPKLMENATLSVLTVILFTSLAIYILFTTSNWQLILLERC